MSFSFATAFMGADRSTRRVGCGELVESEPLSEHANGSDSETTSVGQLPVVETKAFFVKVAKQVKRFDGNVGATDRPVQQRPTILKGIGVNLPVDVTFRIVDNADAR